MADRPEVSSAGGTRAAAAPLTGLARVRHRARRAVAAGHRRVREVRLFATAMASPYHPVQAQVVVTRRCNLACAYCNEFDATSQPVPLEEMLRRIDRLAELGTTLVTLSGGEPLLHPGAEAIVARIRRHGAFATLITNGFLLSPRRIDALNRAGLDHVQISIDNLVPDDVSIKSLRLLDRRLEWLASRAEFAVTVNTVLAGGVQHPDAPLAVARRARELGFGVTIGIPHDGGGQAMPLAPPQRAVYEELRKAGRDRGVFSHAQQERFQDNLVRGEANRWHCPAGSRFLYVCEDGLVHYCSQQRGTPGIPLAEYSRADLVRAFHEPKSCAPRCSLSCVHHVALLDEVRARPREIVRELVDGRRAADPSFTPPVALRFVSWAFLDNPHAAAWTRAAAWLLGLGRSKPDPSARARGAARLEPGRDEPPA